MFIGIKDNNDHLELICYKFRICDEDNYDVALKDNGFDAEDGDDNPIIIVFSTDISRLISHFISVA